MTANERAMLLLEMLAAGTSVEDLRRVQNLPAELLSSAIGIQSRLDTFSERERTFTALLDSVREVSGTGGIDGILFAIVSRARRLLLSEVAYFLTFDAATGRASMTVSDGILTDEFMALEVDRGVGISGHIAATRKPSWTSNYLADRTYQHGEGIDSATVKEGLSALVGVPVMTAGKVLGVLLATAERTATGIRTWTCSNRSPHMPPLSFGMLKRKRATFRRAQSSKKRWPNSVRRSRQHTDSSTSRTDCSGFCLMEGQCRRSWN